MASIVHSSVASDDGGSCELQVASTAAAYAAVVEADSGFYAIEIVALLERFSADVVAIATLIRCPEKEVKLLFHH